jgi:hypothetical protein
MVLLAAILGAKLFGQSVAKLRADRTALLYRGKTIVSANGYGFDGGSLIATGRELVLQKADRQEKIDLRAMEQGWFKDDARWGSHEEATRLRDIAFGRDGGFDTYVSDLAPVGPGKALAILSLSEAAKIARPRTQVLVTLSALPFRIKWLRRLSEMGDGLGLIVAAAHRLYRFRNHLYLNDANQISRVDSSGIVIKKVCAWSIESLPLGLVGDRWVISVTTRTLGRTLEATDLATGKYRVLFSPADSPYLSEDNQPYTLDPLGPYVLYRYALRTVGNCMCGKFLTIRVPDGAVHPIPGVYFTLEPFGPYLVGEVPGSPAKLFFKNGKKAGPMEAQPH